MKQSERILNECSSTPSEPHISQVIQAQRQTAIEFAKWVGENYELAFDCDTYFSIELQFNSEITQKEYENSGKTLDQLYEEWENGNG